MRIFVLTLSTVSALAWVNPFGMYNTSATSALNMVPPAEVHADALKYKCEDIQAAFAAGTDTSNSSLKFKTIPGVDVKGHHLRRCADNQTTLSDLQCSKPTHKAQFYPFLLSMFHFTSLSRLPMQSMHARPVRARSSCMSLCCLHVLASEHASLARSARMCCKI